MVGESIPAPCIVCGEPSRAACPRCKTRYCSKRCQGADWRESHREECSRIARGATPRRGPLPPPPPPTDAVIACPRCHEAIDGATVYYSCCCARVCAACDDAFYESGSDDCALCGTELPATAAESLARTKKWADAGHAAATYELAALYATGDADFGVGIMKMRSRVLFGKFLLLDQKVVSDVFHSCCIIHNMCQIDEGWDARGEDERFWSREAPDSVASPFYELDDEIIAPETVDDHTFVGAPEVPGAPEVTLIQEVESEYHELRKRIVENFAVKRDERSLQWMR